jgi:tRNA-splicing ligase RtcB (3'-phosphate/5'-hydroxy nucleic acid ligase)
MTKCKPSKLFVDQTTVDQAALNQFYDAMKQPFVVKGALMPDAHKGYTLPIGGVIATDNFVVPAYVGYDIGCGLAAVKLGIDKEALENVGLKRIQEAIKGVVPVGKAKHVNSQDWSGWGELDHSSIVTEAAKDRDAFRQLGTLGGGFYNDCLRGV